jgi:hypothetical protein
VATRKRPKYNLKTQVRSAMRKVWQWSPNRRVALAKAKAAYGRYRCAKCGKASGPRDVAVDHIEAAGSIADDLSNLGEFAQRLYFGELQILCREPCHKEKTAQERAARKKAKNGV